MDFIKMQIELLKVAMDSKISKHNTSLGYKVETDNVTFTTDCLYIAIVPKCFWMLDTEKVFDRPPFHLSALDMVKGADTRLELTNEIVLLDGGKKKEKKARVLKAENGMEVFVDEKLLNRFKADKYDTIAYYGHNAKSPVAIICNDMPVGVVCPLSYKR